MQCIHLSVLDTSWSYLHLHLPLTLRCSLTGRLSVVWRPVHMVHHSFTEINPCENRIKSRQSLFFAPSQAPNLPPGSFFFPQVWVRFSANAKKLHNVVFNNEETFPASQLSFFSSAWSFSSEKNGKSVAALLDVTSPVELVDRWTGHSGQRGIQLTVGNPSELSGPQPSKNLLGHIWKRNNWQLFDSLKRVKISPVKPMKKQMYENMSKPIRNYSKQQIPSKHIYDSLRCWPAVTGPTSSEATKTIRPRSRGDRCGSQSSTVSTPPWAATRDLEKMEKMGKRQRTSIGRS